MSIMLQRLADYCQKHPRYATQMIDTVNYGLRKYGFASSYEFWKDKFVNDDDFIMMVPCVADFYEIMEGCDEKDFN